MIDRHVQCISVVVFAAALTVLRPSDAAGQANVGAGPLTGSLAEEEPTTGSVSVGRVKLAPGLTIHELGYDSNVFDEPENARSDYVASLQPDVSAFALLRFAKLSGYGGGDLRYYRDYSSERSTGFAWRGRADILLSRLRPFVAGGQTKTRTRPNGEIDVRADRRQMEVSGGVAFDVSRYGQVYAAANRLTNEFQDALERNVDLGESLNRNGYEYSVGIRSELTPLLAATFYGAYSEDRFSEIEGRNASTRSLNVSLRFGAEAIIAGSAAIAFEDFKPEDPLVKPFRGITGRAGLTYSFMEVGRVSVTVSRSNEFSFDAAEAYYVENTVSLSYTNRLVGDVDAQVFGSKSIFQYGFTERSPDRQDELDSIGAGVGYNLPNRTRISLNFDYSRRRSLQLRERNYDRQRVYLAWTFAI